MCHEVYQSKQMKEIAGVNSMDSQTKRCQTSGPLDRPRSSAEILRDEFAGEHGEFQEYDQDEWLLKYEVNERGIGSILLPPSLAIFLQSDRISIIPMGGGLFVKSIQGDG